MQTPRSASSLSDSIHEKIKVNTNDLIVNISNNLPPCLDIVTKTYSLQPDMIFGWIPKINIPNITPINLSHSVNDSIVHSVNSD